MPFVDLALPGLEASMPATGMEDMPALETADPLTMLKVVAAY